MATNTTVGSATIELDARTTGAVTGITNVTSALNANKVAIAATGAVLAAFAMKTASAIGAATSAFADFNAKITKAAGVAGATTAAEIGVLSEAALDLAGTTKFTANQVSSNFQQLGQAGLSLGQILEATPAIADLATAAVIDMGEAADITTNIMGAFGKETSDLAAVADVLVKASTSSMITVQGLGEAFKFVGAQAAVSGRSLEEMTAAVALLRNVGMEGGMAGRALSIGIQNLLDPTEEAAALMKDLGINVKTAQGSLRPFSEVLAELAPHLKDATVTGTLFTANAQRAFTALLSQGVPAFEKFQKALETANGESRRLAELMEGTLKGSMDKATSATEALQIQMGEALLPVIKPLITDFTLLVVQFNKTSQAFKRGVGVIAGAVGSLAGLTAAFTGLAFVLPHITNGLKLMFGMLKKIALIGAPVAFSIGMIQIVQQLNAAQEAGEDLSTVLERLGIQQGGGFSFENIKNSVIAPFKVGFETMFDTMAEMTGTLGDGIEDIGNLFDEDDIAKKIIEAKKKIKAAMDAATAAARVEGPGAIEAAKAVPMDFGDAESAAEIAEALVPTRVEEAAFRVAGSFHDVSQILEGRGPIVDSALQSMGMAGTLASSVLTGNLTPAINAVVGRILQNSEAFKRVNDRILEVVDSIGEMIEPFLSLAATSIELWMAFRDLISPVRQVAETLSGVVGGFAEKIKDGADRLIGWGRSLFDFSDKTEESTTAMDRLNAKLREVFPTVDSIFDVNRLSKEGVLGMRNLFERLQAEGKTEAADRIKKLLEDRAEKIQEALDFVAIQLANAATPAARRFLESSFGTMADKLEKDLAVINDSLGLGADALQETAEQMQQELSNVPTGFKLALERFRAIQGEEGMPNFNTMAPPGVDQNLREALVNERPTGQGSNIGGNMIIEGDVTIQPPNEVDSTQSLIESILDAGSIGPNVFTGSGRNTPTP